MTAPGLERLRQRLGAPEGGLRAAPDWESLLRALHRAAGVSVPVLDAGGAPPEGFFLVDETELPPGRNRRLWVDAYPGCCLLRRIPGAFLLLGNPARLAALELPDFDPPVPEELPRGREALLVLDVDGVLIEPGRAFHEAVARALAELAPELSWSDARFDAFKRIGSFNNDFRLTAAALALFEAGALDRLEQGGPFPDLEPRFRELEPIVQPVVQRHYASTRCLERPLATLEELHSLPWETAILTGRPPEELELAFQVLGFRLPAVPDAGPHLRKPSPGGLLQLADAFGAASVVFAGDTVDDARCLRSARALAPSIAWTFAAIGPGRSRFAEPEDLQSPSLRELLPMLSLEARA